MLSKLVKHEWKTQSKFFGILNLFLMILTFLGVVFFSFKIWEIESDFISVLSVFSFLFYYFSILAISLGGNLYIASRFYKNFYTVEGYLTHTLPVTQHQLLLSKLIVSCSWLFITLIVVVGSIFSLVMSYNISIGSEFLRVVFQEFPQQLAQFEAETGISVGVSILLFIIISVVSTIFGVLQIYFSISVGQFYKKHKVLGSIVAYFCLSMLLQLCSMFLILPISIRIGMNSFNMVTLYWGIMIGIPVALTLLNLLFYFLTHYILKKKLNLD